MPEQEAAPAAVDDTANDSGGSIAGRVVVVGTAEPAAGTCVSTTPATAEAQAAAEAIAPVQASADGAYTFENLAPGTYTVAFGTCSEDGFAISYHGGTADPATATAVNVDAAQPAVGVDGSVVRDPEAPKADPAATAPAPDATIDAPGAISGTVLDELTGTGIAGICVSATPLGTGAFQSTTTLAGGTYTITGVPTDDYSVSFSDCAGAIDYVFEYYDDTTDPTSALPVHVVNNVTTPGINAELTPTGKVSGRVTSQATGSPIANVCVTTTPFSGSVATGGDGKYQIAGLAPGGYTVRFTPCGVGGFAAADYPGSVAVRAARTTKNIDIALVPDASISGTIIDDDSGDPVTGICASTQFGNSSAPTGSDGHYTITGLAAGAHQVRFSDCMAGLYVTEYYNNAPNQSSATPVVVATGEARTGIDAGLELGGAIEGEVR